MKTSACLVLLLPIIGLSSARCQELLDVKTAKSVLVKPRYLTKGFIPPPSKEPVVSRTREIRTKGVEVEVIEHKDGARQEIAFANIPVFFERDSDQIRPGNSVENLRRLAVILQEALQKDPKALFRIEGHTSSEGSTEYNDRLSQLRAARVFEELTRKYKLAGASLEPVGRGKQFAKFPEDALEEDRQKDRRVLVGSVTQLTP